MRLHTDKLTTSDIYGALSKAQDAGRVASHIYFYVFSSHGSRKRARAFEIQLGTDNKVPGDKRGWKNTGNNGAADTYAATYDEWGYFIAELFAIDPNAVFGTYDGVQSFRQQTAANYRDAKVFYPVGK